MHWIYLTIYISGEKCLEWGGKSWKVIWAKYLFIDQIRLVLPPTCLAARHQSAFHGTLAKASGE